jgi:undecaprenyl diphosphate synthase
MIKHVVLIPDGNRRWAKRKGLLPWQGHLEGAKVVGKILEKVLELKIPYFTFWGGSFDNLTKRTKKEISFLMKVYGIYFKRLLKEKRIEKEKVRINVFGRWREIFPENLKRIVEEAIEKTKKHNRYFLSLLLAYNGTDEMLDCIRKISKISRQKKIKVDENLIKENLWTGSLPPVDLVIRTGLEGDPHNSTGFMMWQTAYSQFYFTKTLFPDFSPKEFEEAINNFLKRERRFGR